jgi:hypothetical protein
MHFGVGSPGSGLLGLSLRSLLSHTTFLPRLRQSSEDNPMHNIEYARSVPVDSPRGSRHPRCHLSFKPAGTFFPTKSVRRIEARREKGRRWPPIIHSEWAHPLADCAGIQAGGYFPVLVRDEHDTTRIGPINSAARDG